MAMYLYAYSLQSYWLFSVFGAVAIAGMGLPELHSPVRHRRTSAYRLKENEKLFDEFFQASLCIFDFVATS